MKNLFYILPFFILFACKTDGAKTSKAKKIDGTYKVTYCAKGEKNYMADETEDFGTINVNKIDGGITIEAIGKVQKIIPLSTASMAQSEDNPNAYFYSNAYGAYGIAFEKEKLELVIKMVYSWNRSEIYVVNAEKVK